MPIETLSDNDAHALLCKMGERLSCVSGETLHGEAALRAAEKAIILLMLGLLAASDRVNDAHSREPPP